MLYLCLIASKIRLSRECPRGDARAGGVMTSLENSRDFCVLEVTPWRLLFVLTMQSAFPLNP